MFQSYDPNDNEAGLKILKDLTSNASQVQQNVLEEILKRNAQTQYPRVFLGGGNSDKESFRSNVPVVNYEDFKPNIERIANGEPSDIISAEPITELFTSSGTSGGLPKMMPSTASQGHRQEDVFL